MEIHCARLRPPDHPFPHTVINILLRHIRRALLLAVRRVIRRLLWKRIFNIPQVAQGGFIWTTDGFMEDCRLHKKYCRAKTPAGWSYAKEYYFEGRLVRRDVTQDVERGLSLQGNQGKSG